MSAQSVEQQNFCQASGVGSSLMNGLIPFIPGLGPLCLHVHGLCNLAPGSSLNRSSPVQSLPLLAARRPRLPLQPVLWMSAVRRMVWAGPPALISVDVG